MYLPNLIPDAALEALQPHGHVAYAALLHLGVAEQRTLRLHRRRRGEERVARGVVEAHARLARLCL